MEPEVKVVEKIVERVVEKIVHVPAEPVKQEAPVQQVQQVQQVIYQDNKKDDG